MSINATCGLDYAHKKCKVPRFPLLRQRRRLLYHTVQTLNPTYIMLLDRFASREVSTRRFWSLPRPQNWFSVLLLRRDLDFWWRQNFRVNRDTFMNIVEIVRPYMTTEDNNFRTATPIEKRSQQHCGVSLMGNATDPLV